MQFLYKLERKFGKYAIPNLMFYLIFGQGIVFFASLINPNLYYAFIFDWASILHGEVWRLITFIFIPTSMEPIWFILMVVIYYSVGNRLESMIGTFNFNFYYFISVLLTVIICAFFGISGNIGTYINMSLWLSLATAMPNMSFYLYMLIPIKAKFLVYLYLAVLAYEVMISAQKFATFSVILASLSGYIIFFVLPLFKDHRSKSKNNLDTSQTTLRTKHRTLDKSPQVIKVAFHKCSVCGKTELDDEDLDFRYCSTCGKEFCEEHLKNHQH
ncbi:MAG: hypothetical protein ATN31_10400 [Candidatus Epulonipiscioides saccharophilum]|nr:MAG: hypothetical protein ATN31_10400 [Epulopiscium sp. AS2M-Bin001]